MQKWFSISGKKSPKKNIWRSAFFVNLALKIQCHIVDIFSAIFPTGLGVLENEGQWLGVFSFSSSPSISLGLVLTKRINTQMIFQVFWCNRSEFKYYYYFFYLPVLHETMFWFNRQHLVFGVGIVRGMLRRKPKK